jgi:RecA-family ATPase
VQSTLDEVGSGVNSTVEDILQRPVIRDGQGVHADIFERYRDLRNAGKREAEAWRLVREIYPHRPQREFDDLARRFKPLTGPVSYDRERKVVRFKVAHDAPTTAIPTSDLGTVDFLKAVFNEGDIICATNYSVERDGKYQPGDSGTFWPLERWCEEFGKRGNTLLSGQAGAWIRINPMIEGDGSGTDRGVADFRHLLVEFDSIESKDEQARIFANSRLPISCLIDSGGKSVHAWVRVEAKTLEEFKERQRIVYEYLADYIDDSGNINPSRFSRLPGVMRGQYKQRLIALNLGPATWEEFERSLFGRELKGGSILDYAKAPIDEKATLLGDRWLCRGGGAFVVAPTGQGKSTLTTYLAPWWANGKEPLGISANGQLRVLIVQAEDDAGDVTEMTRWILNAGFAQEQLSVIARNTHIEPVNDVVGDRFIAVLDDLCRQIKPDLVIINPYTSYLGDDVRDEKAANRFLREGLTPLLVKHNCGALIMHHTPKTQFNPSADFTTLDFVYRGSGCASMSNWARAYLVFEPVNDDQRTFRFVAAKRGKRIGWETVEKYYCHSAEAGKIEWVKPTAEEFAALALKKSAKFRKQVDPAEVLQCIPLLDAEDKKVVFARIVEKTGASRDKLRDCLAILESEGKIHSANIRQQGKRSVAGWSQTPHSESITE